MHCKKVCIFIVSILFISFYFIPTTNADTLGQNVVFFTNSKYDYLGRNKINASLRFVSTRAYFYVEDDYFSGLGTVDKQNFDSNLNQVAQEFDSNIYPKETSFWGSPAVLGNRDDKITILLERLNNGTGGYFDSSNDYAPNIVPVSNYRQMLTISAESINRNSRSPKALIAHEFQHLISFTQKELLRSVDEDTWLNELRSEYSIDLVGYNEPFQNSTLQQRVSEFLQNPSDSLTEWLNQPFEYGAISLLSQYMTEQYGQGILKETLQSSNTGIASINDYLTKHGYRQSFKDIFENWAVANYLNNSSDAHSGYGRPDLTNFHVTPVTNNLFYPFNYTYSYTLKPWQPAWYKFDIDQAVPKSKVIKLEFQTSSNNFGLTYVDTLGHHTLSNTTYLTSLPSSFVLIPYNQNKLGDFTNNDPASTMILNLSFVDTPPVNTTVSNPSLISDGALIKKLGGTDLYVITGLYKRYMSPEAISLYGQLDPQKAYEVTPEVFDSFPTSNYIRVVGTAGIYAVWPDNTKHLFNFNFVQSGRNPKLIFTINPREFNIYKTGVPILR